MKNLFEFPVAGAIGGLVTNSICVIAHLVCSVDVSACIDQGADGPHAICLSGSSKGRETALCKHTGWRGRGRGQGQGVREGKEEYRIGVTK